MKEFHLTRTGDAVVQEVLLVKAETLEEAKKRWAEGDFDDVVSPIESGILGVDIHDEGWEEAK